MSRTGKKPIAFSDKVRVRLEGDVVHVEGPLGKHQHKLNAYVVATIEGKEIRINRKDDSRLARQAHGLTRTLIFNMVHGVSQGFQRELNIEGIGYRAEMKGSDLSLALGFSHPILYPIPKDVKVSVEKQTRIVLTGSDKVQLGQIAADIRSKRPPEPYKGKGIRYLGEVVERKEGKAAGAAGGGAK